MCVFSNGSGKKLKNGALVRNWVLRAKQQKVNFAKCESGRDQIFEEK